MTLGRKGKERKLGAGNLDLNSAGVRGKSRAEGRWGKMGSCEVSKRKESAKGNKNKQE